MNVHLHKIGRSINSGACYDCRFSYIRLQSLMQFVQQVLCVWSEIGRQLIAEIAEIEIHAVEHLHAQAARNARPIPHVEYFVPVPLISSRNQHEDQSASQVMANWSAYGDICNYHQHRKHEVSGRTCE